MNQPTIPGAPLAPHAAPAVWNTASSGVSTLPQRPPLPTRLDSVRLVSHRGSHVDPTSDVNEGESGGGDGSSGSKESWREGSPEDMSDEVDDQAPPAKRMKMETGSPWTTKGTEETEHMDWTRQICPGSPLPMLPKTKPVMKRTASARRQRFGVDPAARRAHGLIPPTAATRVPAPQMTLDFSPWTGNHPEDVLNETVIKGGYFDKVAGSNLSESNSAKGSIWPTLSQKNHAGLSMLSYLYAAVLEKRQVLGKCTAPPTFKPPPRVTVTDTKREAWLRDLANPAIPLRKQSRTIPHGIRGKLLMEQCLSKHIPLSRAVWLAKCVGANELRAFRRKGVSGAAAATGEAKWVREWTVQVEQFLDSIVAMCGQSDWQKNMNYAIKLVAAFYTEQLLDADHFLDWVVSSLTAATGDTLPISLVVAQIFWKDLISFAVRGRRLAVGILQHLDRMGRTNSYAYEPLKTWLQKLVAVLAVQSRGCLIIPRVWEKYKHLLTPKGASTTSSKEGQLPETVARNIARRNERLAAPLDSTASNNRSVTLELYARLDTVPLDIDLEKFADECCRLVPDAEHLIPALLDWASTPYRTGIARVYLSANIISYLHARSVDVDTIILKYLGQVTAVTPTIIAAVHRVVVDLVRTKSFSVGRYLQWLITSGVLYSSTQQTCATGLIAALPDADLPAPVRNTKKMLMARLGYVVNETASVDAVLAYMDKGNAGSRSAHVDSMKILTGLSMSAQFSISRQLCVKAARVAKDSGLSLETFQATRATVEHIGDVHSMAELLLAACGTENCALLASITDTANAHAEALAGLGELQPLLDRLTEQYFTLRAQQPLDRSLILSLTMLARRFPQKPALVRILAEDLTLCEQQNADVVCSPASDSLIGMHATSLDSDADLDAVFASGNTMDEHLMERVYTRITQRAAKMEGFEPSYVRRIGVWLNKLRSVDGSSGVFDRLVSRSIQTTLNPSLETGFSPNVVFCLVSSGCVALSSVAERVKEIKTPRIAWHAFRLFVPAREASTDRAEYEAYHFRLQQSRCQEEYAASLIMLVHTACQDREFPAEDPAMIEFLISCVAAESGSVGRIFNEGSRSEPIRTNAGRIVRAILQPDGMRSQPTEAWNPRSLIRMATPLSIHYCTGALQFFMTCDSFSQRDGEDVVGDAILESFQARSEIWPQLLPIAGEEANGKLHEWARNQLLYLANKDGDQGDAATQDHTKRCLQLLAATMTSAATAQDYASLAVITEKLQTLHRRLTALSIFSSEGRRDLACVLHQLRIILDICVMPVHCSASRTEPGKSAKCTLLATLCTLLVHPRLQTDADLLEYLLDLSSALADHLPDAVASWPTGTKLPRDPRLAFILGPSARAPESSLVLATAPSQQPFRLNNNNNNKSISQPAGSQPAQSQSPRPGWPTPGGIPSALIRPDAARTGAEYKFTPFVPRPWEIIPDPTPVMGENDGSLSLTLFAARKV